MTVSIDRELCVGCGDCVDPCPDDAIEIFDGAAVVTGACSDCLACVSVCFVNAIRPPARDGSPVKDDRPAWRQNRGGSRTKRRMMS